MKSIKRGEIWAADLDPQSYKAEPGKKGRPVLVIQTDALNNAAHQTTIIIPGTSNIESLSPADKFPLRIRVQKTGKLAYDTDLLIDQIRAVSNVRLIEVLCTVGENHLKRVEEAIKLLTRR